MAIGSTMVGILVCLSPLCSTIPNASMQALLLFAGELNIQRSCHIQLRMK